MKVPELKNAIAKYSTLEKDKIIVELYKRLPKKVKEDYDIDAFIMNVSSFNASKKQEKVLTFDELESEIETFLSQAKQGLYCSPNKIVSKADRSKWRFKVKRFYKELIKIDVDSPYYDKATNILSNIYLVLSYGSNSLLFSNWETFRAVGVSQADFYNEIMKRKMKLGYTPENIEYCVKLLNADSDPYELYDDVLHTFERNLLNDDTKRLAIELLEVERKICEEKVKEVRKAKKSDYYIVCQHDYFVFTICDLHFLLGEMDEGINYYHKYSLGKEHHREIKEYVILERLKRGKYYEAWVKEYEKASKKIKLRDELQEDYIKIKKELK